MAEYRKGAHTVYDLKYHLVWVTKYRYEILEGEIAKRARDIIREVCMSKEITIIKDGHVSRNHVHLFVSSPPRLLQHEYPSLRKPAGIGDNICGIVDTSVLRLEP